jgi:hypothetical protein
MLTHELQDDAVALGWIDEGDRRVPVCWLRGNESLLKYDRCRTGRPFLSWLWRFNAVDRDAKVLDRRSRWSVCGSEGLR